MLEISWIAYVRNEEVGYKIRIAKEKRNILRTVKRGKANWIGGVLRRNCLSKHVIEGEIGGGIEVT